MISTEIERDKLALQQKSLLNRVNSRNDYVMMTAP